MPQMISPGIKQALTTRKVIGIGGVHNYSLGRQLHMKTYDMASLRKFTAAQVWKETQSYKENIVIPISVIFC
jgi:hypothetical protein